MLGLLCRYSTRQLAVNTLLYIGVIGPLGLLQSSCELSCRCKNTGKILTARALTALAVRWEKPRHCGLQKT